MTRRGRVFPRRVERACRFRFCKWFVAARFAILLAVVVGLVPAVLSAIGDAIRPIPPELRRSASLDPFYQKCTMVGQLPIVGSAKVSDFALLEAAYIIRHMLAGRDDILRALAAR